jgi:hypothetical protein
MNAKINYLVTDADALEETIVENRAAMDEKGFDPDSYNALTSSIADLKTKETAQQEAEEAGETNTAGLDAYISILVGHLSKLRLAAKSVFVNDKRMQKVFNVGLKIPESVAKLTPMINKLNAEIDKYKPQLIKKGFAQEKIDALIAAPVQLEMMAKAQENAKKLQKSKTIERNAAVKELQIKMREIRNFAAINFADKPEILVQFDPIPKGRGKNKDHDEGGEDGNQTPPENNTP